MNLITLKKIYSQKKDKILFAVLLLLIVSAMALPMSKSETTAHAAPPEADTLIPNGFVLVPIELENQRSLDSIVGSHAIVNLYKGSQLTDQKGKLVARHLRLLRAPLNPEQFAVLVPENDVAQFATPAAKFYAVVENRRRQEAATVSDSVRVKRQVEYFQGGSR